MCRGLVNPDCIAQERHGGVGRYPYKAIRVSCVSVESGKADEQFEEGVPGHNAACAAFIKAFPRVTMLEIIPGTDGS